MASFNEIGPWITAAVLFAAVAFFCVFYIVKLLHTRKTAAASVDTKLSGELGSAKAPISKEQRKKLKDEIVHDIVADITPVLEKRLEKAF